MSGDTTEDVLEPGERINVNALARSYEAAQHGCRLSPDVTAKKHPVATADGYAADRTFCAVVVDLQILVFGIANQRLPVLERVAHSPAFAGFWAAPQPESPISIGAVYRGWVLNGVVEVLTGLLAPADALVSRRDTTER